MWSNHAAYPTVTRGRGLSTRRHAWSAICSCAQSTIFRCACPPRRLRYSTCCAAKLYGPCENRWWLCRPNRCCAIKKRRRTFDELAEGHFHTVLDETDDLDPTTIKRLIICSGKVFYDLRAARRERSISDIALVRIEQLYPFPEEDLTAVVSQYRNIEDAIWCQEEPMNQGAWYASQHHMRRVIQRHKVDVYLALFGSRSLGVCFSWLHRASSARARTIY